jgi:hypothetical protein
MKYILIVFGLIALLIFIGYQYINYKIIRDQEEAYKTHATLDFKESPRSFPDSVRMVDAQFWELIEDSKSKNPSDYNAQMDYLIQLLSSLTNKEIVGFEATLREKIIDLGHYNVKSLYQILWGEYISTDNYLYFKFWIISNGRDFYHLAINDPDGLTDRIEFTYEGERLMSVADFAFKMKNGSNSGLELPRDVTLSVDYDFGLYKISGKYIAPSDFEKQFPKLTEKFK